MNAAAAADAMSGMGMSMSSTFSTSTRVTLFFTTWTTTSTAAYAGTMIFLFLLAVFNRYLAALKTQLELAWKDADAQRLSSAPPGSLSSASKRARHSVFGAEQHDPETEPLSPPPYVDVGSAESGRSTELRGGVLPWRWEASGPWRVSRDGTRAALEFSRAFIGYMLMLAVMTFNVGFFFAVLGGVLVGELVLGRYVMSSSSSSNGAVGLSLSGWQEGGCHDG